MNNPHLKHLLDKMLDERIRDATSKGESSGSRLLTSMTPKDIKPQQNSRSSANKIISKAKTVNQGNTNAIVKSPSDTTIYALALNRVTSRFRDRQDMVPINNQLQLNNKSSLIDKDSVLVMDQGVEQSRKRSETNSTDVMMKISNFVDQLRIEHDQEEEEEARCPKSKISAPGLDDVQKRMEQVIIETEKFQAAVEKPPSMFQNVHQSPIEIEVLNNAKLTVADDASSDIVTDGCNQSNQRQVVGSGISDDDFFDLTCHIEPLLQKKIERGEFVDLDKLLPKDSFQSRHVSNKTKLEWVQSEGSTYLVPAKSTSRVNCFCRWEQAFRMYATIYCTKNPNRAREIWQYVSVINTTSISFNWDNVYNYDIVFRQLMEFNPGRSWAVTYNQMWNLSMTNPISHNQSRKSFGVATIMVLMVVKTTRTTTEERLIIVGASTKATSVNLARNVNSLRYVHIAMTLLME